MIKQLNNPEVIKTYWEVIKNGEPIKIEQNSRNNNHETKNQLPIEKQQTL